MPLQVHVWDNRVSLEEEHPCLNQRRPTEGRLHRWRIIARFKKLASYELGEGQMRNIKHPGAISEPLNLGRGGHIDIKLEL